MILPLTALRASDCAPEGAAVCLPPPAKSEDAMNNETAQNKTIFFIKSS